MRIIRNIIKIVERLEDIGMKTIIIPFSDRKICNMKPEVFTTIRNKITNMDNKFIFSIKTRQEVSEGDPKRNRKDPKSK